MPLDRAPFFAAVRTALFGGRLTALQVSGMERLLVAFERYGTRDRRHLAYILATSFHETGRRMQPVREGFATSDAAARAAVAKLLKQGRISRNYALPNAAGQSFYGRGDVQLTHEENYRRMGAILGIDLVGNPDLALDPATSGRILVEGVLRAVSAKGDFTAYSLEDFIAGARCDYVAARRTVNGTDQAAAIAGYATAFETALVAAGLTAILMPPDPGNDNRPAALCPTCGARLAA